MRIFVWVLFIPFLLSPSPAAAKPTLATPTLSQTGTCPGSKTLTVTGATPLSNVAIVRGGAGTSIKTGNPCNGMTINVTNPILVIVRLASSGGVMVTGGILPPGMCGQSVCAIDIATCTSSAPLIL